MALPPDIQELIDRWDFLKATRRPHESAWQEILDLMEPFRGDITTLRAEGTTRIEAIFDSTAMNASNSLVNFLKGTVFPASQAWLKFTPPKEFSDNIDARQLLELAAERVLTALSGSNFYIQAAQALSDLVLIGNMSMLVEERPPVPRGNGNTFGGMIFETVAPGRFWWQAGKGGEIVFLVRVFHLPAVDALRFFPEATPNMRKVREKGPFERVMILHFVYKNEGQIAGVKTTTDKLWVSDWISLGDGSMDAERIRQRGFDNSPYINARWRVVKGEEYGRGLGHIARPDAKGINKLREQVLIATGRELNPPLMVEHEAVIQLDAGPSGVITTKFGTQPPAYLRSGSNFSAANDVGVTDRQQILAIFLADLIGEPETQSRSAEDARARQIRAFQRLAASAEVIDTQFITPAVTSTAEIMHTTGALPEFDEYAELTGGAIANIQFSSPFFTGQKQGEVQKMTNFVDQRIARFNATQDFQWIDRIDPDAVTKFEAENSDVDPIIFRSDEELEEIRNARAERNAQARALQQAQQASEVQSNLATAQR